MSNKFKTGDKIIYIKYNNAQTHFTRNKEYVVFDGYPECEYNIIMRNNYGFLLTVDQDMFIDIKEYRKQKLKEICSK